MNTEAVSPHETRHDLQRAHPPTAELKEMETHELVFEMELYRAHCVAGDKEFPITTDMRDRILSAQVELAHRFRQSWIVRGVRSAGGN